jgi:hypothetical protein
LSSIEQAVPSALRLTASELGAMLLWAFMLTRVIHLLVTSVECG